MQGLLRVCDVVYNIISNNWLDDVGLFSVEFDSGGINNSYCVHVAVTFSLRTISCGDKFICYRPAVGSYNI